MVWWKCFLILAQWVHSLASVHGPGQRMELSCWLCSCCGKFWMECFLVVQMRRSIVFVEVVSLGQCISLSNPEHQNPGIGWGFVPELQLTITKKSVILCIQCSDPRKYLVITQMYNYMYKMYTRWWVNDDRIYIFVFFLWAIPLSVT